MIFIGGVYFNRNNSDFNMCYRARRRVFFAAILKSSSFITLLVFYSGRNDLIFKVAGGLGAYNLDIYDFDVYSPGAYGFSV